MSVKIAFLERKQTEVSRKSFQDFVKGLGINISNNWEELSKDIPTILFYHGGDEIELREGSRGNKPFRSELAKVFLIEYGGDPTDNKAIVENRISYIKYNDLEAKLKDSIAEINSLQSFTAEKLHNIIFDFDPKLEELLKSFAETSPYETNNKQGKILKEAKAELHTYVEDYLKKQSKP